MIINGNELIGLILSILIFSISIDSIFGELPTKTHPVVFIGNIIDFFSKYLIKINNRLSGVFLTIIVSIVVIIVFLIILFLATYNVVIFLIFSSIILSSTFSIKMLLSSAKKIKEDLEEGIDIARKSMSYLVSRDTTELSENLIISATIETLSENITDSAIAPIFYYILANIILILGFLIIHFINPYIDFQTIYSLSLPIFTVIIAILVAIIYRIINTLDAMVGYKNEKYIMIGFFPAKLDDILNYIPARFGGIMIIFASMIYEKLGNKEINWKNSYKIMKRHARKPLSPNSGFTMAAVAGSLNISLVKKGVYVIGNNINSLKGDYIEKIAKLSRFGIYLAILFLIFILISTLIFIFSIFNLF